MTDSRMKKKIQNNLDKLNSAKFQKEKIDRKKLYNKLKGKEFLQTSTRIGRELKEKKKVEKSINNIREEGVNEKSDYPRKYNSKLHNERKEFYEDSVDEEDNKENFPRSKRRRNFHYIFKKAKNIEPKENQYQSQFANKLVIGSTQDLSMFSNKSNLAENTKDFLMMVREKDRFIKSKDADRLINLRFRSHDGRPFRSKNEFIVDSIREKLNFIKKIV